MSAGKGDTRRPSAVATAEFEANWWRTFRKAVQQTTDDIIAADAARLDAEIMGRADDDRA